MANDLLINRTDLNDLIFAKKNKNYGAYSLRKSYKTYLSYAMWIAIFAVIIAAVAPKIYRWMNPEEIETKKVRKVVITDLAPPPSIGSVDKPT